ncbi:hypothetical protein M0R45_001956 [Rubus argutus]|uniref:Cytochrome P450 n=1 Tax=Rubus argutus TaxID=59490 RepID=A0AAW1VHU1_RUBAR
MEISLGVWVALVVGGLPFFGLLLWWWNEFRYGDGVGMYRTHLFGTPSIITCLPAVNKFIFQSEEAFSLNWPNVDLVGSSSLVAVQGSSHARLRSYVINVISKPNALRRIAGLVQPRMVAAFESWALKGRIKAYDESKKVTVENIGKLFVSLEPGPLLDTIDKFIEGVVKGFRAHPFNVPGSALSLCSSCLIKTNDEGDKLSDKEVIDNIVSLVIGGYTSTALSTMWAIYYLAKYPNVLQKLREENMIISQNKNGDFITSDDVSKMKYTNKVVEETIRLANIAERLFSGQLRRKLSTKVT